MLRRGRKKFLAVCCIVALLITAIPVTFSKSALADESGEILTGKGWWSDDRYEMGSGVSSRYYAVEEGIPLQFYIEVQELSEKDGTPYGAFSAEIIGDDTNGTRCWFTTNSSKTAWVFDESGVSMDYVGGSADEETAVPDHYDSQIRSELQLGHTYRVTIARSGSDYEVSYFDMDAQAEYCTLTLTGYRALKNVKANIIAQEGTYKVSCSGKPASDNSDTAGDVGEEEEVSLPTPDYMYDFDSGIGDAVVVNRQNEDEEGKVPAGEIPQPDASANAKYVVGKNGKALNLDGSYGLKLPVSNLGKSYTISFWVKVDEEMVDYAPILFAGRDILGEDDLHWLSITKAEWEYEDDYSKLELGGCPVVWSRIQTVQEAGWPWYSSGYNGRTYAITQKEGWCHVILTVDADAGAMYYPQDYEGHQGRTYINGELYGEGCVAKDVYDGIVDTYLGINAWDNKFKGYIDDLAFYSQAVTDKQVKEMYYNAGGFDSSVGQDKDPEPTAAPDQDQEPSATTQPSPAPKDPDTPTATADPGKTAPDDDYDDYDDLDGDSEEDDEQSLILKKGETCRVTGGEYMALCDSIDMVIPGAKGPAKCNILGLSSKWNMAVADEVCGGSYDYPMVKKKAAVTYYVTCTKSKMAVYVKGKSAKIKKVKTKCLKKYTLKAGKKMRISAKSSKGVMFFASGKGAKVKVSIGKKTVKVKNGGTYKKKGKKTKVTLKNVSKKKMVILVPNYTYIAKVTGSKNLC